MKRTEEPFFTPEQIKVIKNDILKGAPEFEIERFLITCERTGLDPFSRQIYGHIANKKQRKQGVRGNDANAFEYVKTVVIITSIDGFRAIGERSGQYRGQTAPEWYYLDHEGKSDWHNVFITARDRKGNPLKVPDACRVGVLRESFAAPCYGVANFESFAKYFKEDANSGGDWVLDTFWKKMPEHMIAKVAEAQAFRKAFPLLACGLFMEEEVRAEEDDEVKPGHEAPAGATFVSLPAPAQAPAAPVSPAPVAPAPVTPAAPEKPAEAPAAPAADAPKVTKGRKKAETAAEAPADPAPAAPVTPAAPVPVAAPAPAAGAAGWQGHVIAQITMTEYAGRKVGELSPAEVEFLKTKWVDKYAQKIALNPAKVIEAKMISEAFAHHFPA